MTAAAVATRSGPVRSGSVLRLSVGRLFRLELRRNAMAWMMPLSVALFWFDTFRSSMAVAPLWGSRAIFLAHGNMVLDFAPFVAGAAAWMGSRDGRRGTGEQVAITALPRWAARLAVWTATTCWAMAAYVCCVGALYGVTAWQGAAGDPLWWPVAVGAAGVAAYSALGFAAGTWLPSRFAAPLAAIVALLSLLVTQGKFVGQGTYALISPSSWHGDLLPDAGAFYRYLPDLAITRILFFGGLVLAAIGSLGLPAASGGRWLRSAAAALTAAGLAVAGTALGLAGTARIEANGVVIPRLHNAADDRPVAYTPVCGRSAIPVCMNPVYRAYLPNVTAALDPVLRQSAGLPGAPVRVAQVAFPYQTAGPVPFTAATVSGNPPVLSLALDIGDRGAACLPPPPGRPTPCGSITHWWTTPDLVDYAVRAPAATAIIGTIVGGNGPAQQAVSVALLMAAGVPLVDASSPGAFPPGFRAGPPGTLANQIDAVGPESGTPVYAAAHRFAAFPAAARRAWLTTHLTALRSGHITLAQLP